uniref:Ribosomal protein L16 n=1 Tax=Melanothamnus gigas TaxID=3016206 RepID=A0A9F1U5C7_9FLOR|nr:Ribosomal protein L16 [Melanothamnus gigas]WAX04157.1 Ribosomal protein L16 [Melanothamnus gigas]
MSILQKKQHFQFKHLFSYKKHILKHGNCAFKLNYTYCFTFKQEEFLKLFILKNLKQITVKKIKIFFNSHCFNSQTKLPLESRMGKGKGEIMNLFGNYKKGFILFELCEISILQARRLQTFLNKKKIARFKLIF